MEKVNLSQKFALFDDFWSPKIVAEVDGHHVRLAKLQGEFVWHTHDDGDELFLVVRGALTVRLRDRDVELREGELFVVPQGVEHMPVAEEECHALVVVSASAVNTGADRNERTVEELERI